MSDLFGNHIVGFPTRWLIYCSHLVFDFIVKKVFDRPKHDSFIKQTINCTVVELLVLFSIFFFFFFFNSVLRPFQDYFSSYMRRANQ